MTNFLFLFAILLFLAYFCNYFLSHSFLGYRWRLFVAPGVIFHELCHALACKLTFAKIVSISFFDKDGGSVTHQKSPVPIIPPILIATAPLVLGILVFYFLASRIQITNTLDVSTLFHNFKSVISSINFTWLNILFIYLLISVAVTMTPSRQDLTNMLFPIIILGVIYYLLSRFTAISINNYDFIFTKLSIVLNLVIFILFAFFLISFVFYFVSKFVLKR